MTALGIINVTYTMTRISSKAGSTASKRAWIKGAVVLALGSGVIAIAINTSSQSFELESKLLTLLDTTEHSTTTGEAIKGETNAIRDDLLSLVGVSVEAVWESLLTEGAAANIHNGKSDAPVVVEVGVHKARQCLQAAELGWTTHCVEPSPKSFSRVKYQLSQASKDIQSRVFLHNVAAGPTSGGIIPFTASGGTGDHAGAHDMWTMEQTPEKSNTGGKLIEVPSMRLDSLIKEQIGGRPIFLLKVDTQGFESAVFSGLTEALKGPDYGVHYILTEYWPKGMDLQAGKKKGCVAANLLLNLAAEGYALYALPMEAHPKAPKKWQRHATDRPLNDIRANCQWYYDFEDRMEPKNNK